MGPHVNGKFTTDKGVPVESSIKIDQYTAKTTLHFIYTVPAVPACSPAEKSTNVQVTIYIAPEAGDPQNLELCGTTDLAGYANLDLNDQLTGEDSGGTWTGIGISSATDHNINLQELFDANGPGEYFYTYTVLAVPNNYICENDDATVKILLEKDLILQDQKLPLVKISANRKLPRQRIRQRLHKGQKVFQMENMTLLIVLQDLEHLDLKM